MKDIKTEVRFYCENISKGYRDADCTKPCGLCDQSKKPNSYTKEQENRASK